MRIPYLGLLIIILLNCGVDWYIYKCLRRLRTAIPGLIQLWSAVILALGLLSFFVMPVQNTSDAHLRALMWVIFIYITIYVPKYIFVIFNAIAQIPRLWHKRPYSAVTWTGAVIAGILFLSLWWGALFNRFDIDVKEVDVEIAQLPRSFEGFKIAQISDLHVGTYGENTDFIEQLVERINSLCPDMVLFTGDIVNRHTDELKPFVPVLSEIKAKYGVYSILGNHDYGDYYRWKDSMERENNNLQLYELQKQMGWKLLRNEHDYIAVGSDTLVIVGVENIGDPPFNLYGDLTKAYPTPTDSKHKILLSHNPAHWVKDIADSDNNIDLTLSGHTHAMQMELFGWSPSSFRYKTWGGLYCDSKGRYLYVNIGTGTVGFPARIGATPEITLITLNSKK